MVRMQYTAAILVLACPCFLSCSATPRAEQDLAEESINGPVRLLGRSMHQDYEKSTFSLELGIRDDPDNLRTKNDWDIQYGNGGSTFHVTMVTDDRSRIIDLGAKQWHELDFRSLPVLPAHPEPTREPEVPTVLGHIYMVHTVDSESDSYGLFRVEGVDHGDWVDISWMRIEPTSWKVVGVNEDA